MDQPNSLAQRRDEPTIVNIMQSPAMRDQIAKALPRHVTPDRMLRMALTCLRNTPKLLQCNQQSVLAAIVELAQLGLEPSTPLGQAWILPYKTTAQVIIGYKGFVALADRCGIVLRAECVYADDQFAYALGTEEFIKHVPSDKADPGPLKYAYCVARFRDGRTTFKVCTRADIERAKQASSAARSGKRDSPWFTDEPAMWRKTAVRRLAPFLPLSAEFVRAVEIDDTVDAGVPQIFDLTPPEVRNEIAGDEISDRLSRLRAEAAEDTTPPPTETVPVGNFPIGDRGFNDKA